jgi:NAD(P)-dependent dehydrogenase (short-subunit alcohol dehydrogenase family)
MGEWLLSRRDSTIVARHEVPGIMRKIARPSGTIAEAGAKVALTGRREKEGADVVAAIIKNGGTAAFVRADVAKDAEVVKAIDFVLSTYGRLDVAFNNAGVEITGPLPAVTEEDYRRTFDINVWGVLNSMKHEIVAMLKNGGGAIVNTSSVAGHIGLPQASLYVATKHAVEGLTKAVALEFAKQGVRVNSVAPRDDCHRHGRPDGGQSRRCAELAIVAASGRSVRHQRRGRGCRPLPCFRRGEIYHRHHPVGRRRMDRSVIGASTERGL